MLFDAMNKVFIFIFFTVGLTSQLHAQLMDSSRIEIRLSILEEEVFELRGEVERLQHQLDQLTIVSSPQEPIVKTPSSPSSSAPREVSQFYKDALILLKNGEYDQAEQSFRSFLSDYGDHDLAPNARYWLGESFYARKFYQQAVIQFGESYESDPQGVKAVDNLLKLALSLNLMGETSAACRALEQVVKLFPNANDAILKKQKKEYQRLACTQGT